MWSIPQLEISFNGGKWPSIELGQYRSLDLDVCYLNVNPDEPKNNEQRNQQQILDRHLLKVWNAVVNRCRLLVAMDEPIIERTAFLQECFPDHQRLFESQAADRFRYCPLEHCNCSIVMLGLCLMLGEDFETKEMPQLM